MFFPSVEDSDQHRYLDDVPWSNYLEKKHVATADNMIINGIPQFSQVY